MRNDSNNVKITFGVAGYGRRRYFTNKNPVQITCDELYYTLSLENLRKNRLFWYITKQHVDI